VFGTLRVSFSTFGEQKVEDYKRKGAYDATEDIYVVGLDVDHGH